METIVVDKDLPGLYRYLSMCAAEQIGKHMIGDYDSDAPLASEQDKELIKTYISSRRDVNSTWKPENGEDIFFELFCESLDSMTIHRSRDCQIYEMGAHYASLTYRVQVTPTRVHGIRFSVCFRQQYGTLPEGPPEVSICEFIEIGPDVDLTPEQKELYRGTIVRSNGTIHERSAHSKVVNMNDDIVKRLDCSHLIPDDYVVTPKLTPDACIIS